MDEFSIGFHKLEDIECPHCKEKIKVKSIEHSVIPSTPIFHKGLWYPMGTQVIKVKVEKEDGNKKVEKT